MWISEVNSTFLRYSLHMRLDTEALFAGLGIQLASATLLLLPLAVLGTVLDLFFHILLSTWLFWVMCTFVLICTGIAGASVVYYARQSPLRTSLAFTACSAAVWDFYWIARYG